MTAANPPFDVNRSFYAMDPHGYLRRRLSNLMLVYGKGEEIEMMVGAGIKAGTVGFSMQAPSSEAAADDRHRFVLAESQVLLHHVSETLLRLYLAHRDLPETPWFELGQERNFARFKKKVRDLRERIGSGEETGAVHRVFHGSSEREHLQPAPTPEDWEAAGDNLGDFLRCFASFFLEADAYNAAKHGLALSAGNAAVTSTIERTVVFQATGACLKYLTERRGPKGREWQVTTSWIDVDHSIALALIGCDLIELLWMVNESRYTDAEPSEVPLADRPTLEEVVGEDGLPVERVSFGLGWRPE